MASQSGGPTFVPDPGVDEPNYRRGERVVHGTFGSGTIQEVTESLGDIRVTVRFDSGFSKKLVAALRKAAERIIKTLHWFKHQSGHTGR